VKTFLFVKGTIEPASCATQSPLGLSRFEKKRVSIESYGLSFCPPRSGLGDGKYNLHHKIHNLEHFGKFCSKA